MYANDGTLQVVSKDIRTIELKSTDAFAKIANWMKLNKLTIFLGKTKVQLISSYKRVKKNIHPRNKLIDVVTRNALIAFTP